MRKINIQKYLEIAIEKAKKLKVEYFTQEWLKKGLSFFFLIFITSFIILFQLAEAEIQSESKSFQINKEKKLQQVKLEKNWVFRRKMRNLVRGYPIEQMVPYINPNDPKLAGFIVGIAKKESNWGKRAPVLEGADCFNYWGYRATRERMGTAGHTCFENPRDAVESISKTLNYYIDEKQYESAEEMVVWKCGSKCEEDNPEAVQKWIDDVDLYYSKVTGEKTEKKDEAQKEPLISKK